jgi:hypothetical protein
VDRLPEMAGLLRVLAPDGVATAFIVQAGRILLERVRGRNRIAEIRAESEACRERPLLRGSMDGMGACIQALPIRERSGRLPYAPYTFLPCGC